MFWQKLKNRLLTQIAAELHSTNSHPQNHSHDTCKDAKLSNDAKHLLKPTTKATLGFISVIDLPSVGHCGGLLTVSHLGRPLEFHCTTPVAVNRAQQIIYGQTYQGFLYAEQIGAALVDKIKLFPQIILTTCPDMLPVSEIVDAPVILVEDETDEAKFDGTGLKHFTIDQSQYWCVNTSAELLPAVELHLKKFVAKLPIDEPFERIAQAIEEAHSVFRAA